MFRRTETFHRRPSAQRKRVKRLAALVALGVGLSVPVQLAPGASFLAATAAARTATTYSPNHDKTTTKCPPTCTTTTWAGYAVTMGGGKSFSSVSGSWTEPSVSCTGTQAAAAFWVGLDGLFPTLRTVEQIGTDSDCTKQGKTVSPSYYAWWEMYPSASVPFGTKYPVSPGDVLTASVSQTGGVGGSVVLSMSSSKGWSFTTTQKMIGNAVTAEWITETPKINGKIPPLADFGSVTFTGTEASGQAIPSFSPYYELTLANGNTARAVPGPLTGSAFTVDWEHA